MPKGSTTISFASWPDCEACGKAFATELIRKDGTEEIVLHVPHYDFNWQPIYEFKEALRIEREKSFVAAHDMTTAREILPTRIPPAR
jgi:hypothetical protein